MAGTGLGCARACTQRCAHTLPSDIVNPGLQRSGIGGIGSLWAGRNSTGKGIRVETKPGVLLWLNKSAYIGRMRIPSNGACNSSCKATSDAVSHFCQRELTRA